MGKLIVIEGLDGSGKGTQAALLVKNLEVRGLAVRKVSFPDYASDSSALVKMYLSGQFGSDPSDVNAYAASTFYAVDRFASFKRDWGTFYGEGGIVVADRYTTSNAVHQCSKLPREQWDSYLRWLFDFEYGKLGLPAPTRVLYLDMPTELTEQMMRRREQRTHTHADIHEQNAAYLRACRENAAFVVDYCGWRHIDCADGSRILPPEEIAARVLREVEDLLVRG